MNIGISGPIGAGKTTAAKYLASTHGLSYLRYSEILAEMLGTPDSEKQTLRKLGWEIMSKGLQSSLNERLLSKMSSEIDHVIDGLRHPLDFESLSSRPPFYLLYIEASPNIRWQRLRSRDASKTWEEFLADEKHPVEGYLPSLREKAYKTLQNEGPLAELHANLDIVINEIRELARQ